MLCSIQLQGDPHLTVFALRIVCGIPDPIAQGKAKAKIFLEENPEIARDLESKLRAKLFESPEGEKDDSDAKDGNTVVEDEVDDDDDADDTDGLDREYDTDSVDATDEEAESDPPSSSST